MQDRCGGTRRAAPEDYLTASQPDLLTVRAFPAYEVPLAFQQAAGEDRPVLWTPWKRTLTPLHRLEAPGPRRLP